MRGGPDRSGDCWWEQGQITLFGVGVVMMMLVVSGFGLDLWRVLDERRSLVELADAAAAAGANGVDRQRYRDSGVIVLDPGLAEQFTWGNLSIQRPPDSLTDRPTVSVSPESVTVSVRGRVPLTLLAILAPSEGIELSVTATAGPRVSGTGGG